MLLLSVPFDQTRASAPAPPWAAALQVAATAVVLMVAGLALGARDGALGFLGRAVAGGAAHAGLVGLGWVLLAGDRPGWRGPVLRLSVLVIGVSAIGRMGAWGSLAYLVVPVALLAEARRRPGLAIAGLSWPRPRAAALGLGAGIFLGGHLLTTSWSTFGYVVRIDSPAEYLAAAAYDIGLSALTAEWLFRGALFSWWWRRGSFALAAGLSSGLAILRYLLDLNLPSATEAWLGAAFYTGLLGVAGCALRAWSRSLVPGYLATVAFLLAYRTLGH